ncbi:SDR family NAD(P)-dependent oxidoreductase [Rhodococcus sp. NPDC019627]|jgi:NAD(P)-dependent dehydrogenase (short-subunit alcohol dehydrogenase family)|uniref:SDR family NAD(P)-dependent oxidoreductase n=1 Tax=Rhodococcus TaxID=1827 RepID=UPI0010F2582C|nr:SDR family oxidoreductase [Rhodococcus koreensis]QSE86780.1 SDR family oxidoreductase [Rhodococcus koreensis]RYE42663.1 MAG: SDR family oxidoreductase [Hyphomicrobiales bacterium]
MSSIESKVLIVTGALGGIGGATARLLADAGAHVVASDVIDSGGAELAEELSARGAKASFFAADLAEEDQARALVDHAVERFARLDGAFNNAGVPQHEKLLVNLTSEEFSKVMRINVLGVFHCLKHQMLAMTDGGSIVNTSSGLGVIAMPNAAEYIASKHAVCGLTRAAAVEGGPDGIRVNALLPGIVRTPMVESVFGSLDAPEFQEGVRALHLLGRLAEPEEIGQAARWLLSDESSFVTGALIPVDGGVTAGRRM